MIKYTPQIISVGWDKVLDIGAGRQVFWDDYLVDVEQTTARLTLNHPTKLEPPFAFDAPWEGNWLSYGNVSKVGDTYRLYYITGTAIGAEDLATDTGRSLVCMIETKDGITWTRPSLGLHEWNGSTDNNIVMASGEHLFDNFLVFWDENPDCPEDERVKATSMMERKELALSEGRRELWCYVSSDGIRFKKGWKMTDSSEPMQGLATLRGSESINDSSAKKNGIAMRYRSFCW